MTLLQGEQVETEAPDYAAGSLLRNLARPIAWRMSWDLVRTLLLAGVSFGIAPLLFWPSRLRDLIAAERNRYLQLAEWMRSISGERARRLTLAAERIRPQPALAFVPSLAPLAVLAVFGMALMRYGASERIVLGSTWKFSQAFYRSDDMTNLFLTWTFCLSAGYLLHWFHLLWHQARVRDAVIEFNHLAAAEGVAPVPVRSGYGVRPLWLVAGLLLMGGASAIWAIPMTLAGALQRRYATAGLPALQGHLGLRVRELLSHRRPAMFVPTPVSTPRRCPNERCRASVARVANFCPRCGTHVGPDVNQLA